MIPTLMFLPAKNSGLRSTVIIPPRHSEIEHPHRNISLGRDFRRDSKCSYLAASRNPMYSHYYTARNERQTHTVIYRLRSKRRDNQYLINELPKRWYRPARCSSQVEQTFWPDRNLSKSCLLWLEQGTEPCFRKKPSGDSYARESDQ